MPPTSPRAETPFSSAESTAHQSARSGSSFISSNRDDSSSCCCAAATTTGASRSSERNAAGGKNCRRHLRRSEVAASKQQRFLPTTLSGAAGWAMYYRQQFGSARWPSLLQALGGPVRFAAIVAPVEVSAVEGSQNSLQPATDTAAAATDAKDASGGGAAAAPPSTLCHRSEGLTAAARGATACTSYSTETPSEAWPSVAHVHPAAVGPAATASAATVKTPTAVCAAAAGFPAAGLELRPSPVAADAFSAAVPCPVPASVPEAAAGASLKNAAAACGSRPAASPAEACTAMLSDAPGVSAEAEAAVGLQAPAFAFEGGAGAAGRLVCGDRSRSVVDSDDGADSVGASGCKYTPRLRQQLIKIARLQPSGLPCSSVFLTAEAVAAAAVAATQSTANARHTAVTPLSTALPEERPRSWVVLAAAETAPVHAEPFAGSRNAEELPEGAGNHGEAMMVQTAPTTSAAARRAAAEEAQGGDEAQQALAAGVAAAATATAAAKRAAVKAAAVGLAAAGEAAAGEAAADEAAADEAAADEAAADEAAADEAAAGAATTKAPLASEYAVAETAATEAAAAMSEAKGIAAKSAGPAGTAAVEDVAAQVVAAAASAPHGRISEAGEGDLAVAEETVKAPAATTRTAAAEAAKLVGAGGTAPAETPPSASTGHDGRARASKSLHAENRVVDVPAAAASGNREASSCGTVAAGLAAAVPRQRAVLPEMRPSRRQLQLLNTLEKDKIYYLDGASAFAACCLGVAPGDRVLDLCAAPGGKSLILATQLFFGSLASRPLAALASSSAPASATASSSSSFLPFPSSAPSCSPYAAPNYAARLAVATAPIFTASAAITAPPGTGATADVSPPSSTHSGFLVCNETSKTRAERLHATLRRHLPGALFDRYSVRVTCCSGVPGNGPTGGMHASFARFGPYDKILVDAPCSSDRHVLHQGAAALARWSSGVVKANAERQLLLLRTAVELLKVGGVILYCTCSLAAAENDQVIEKLLRTEWKHRKEGWKTPRGKKGSSSSNNISNCGLRVLPVSSGRCACAGTEAAPSAKTAAAAEADSTEGAEATSGGNRVTIPTLNRYEATEHASTAVTPRRRSSSRCCSEEASGAESGIDGNSFQDVVGAGTREQAQSASDEDSVSSENTKGGPWVVEQQKYGCIMLPDTNPCGFGPLYMCKLQKVWPGTPL